MNVLTFARDEVLCVEISGSSSSTRPRIPIASFFWDRCGPSDSTRFCQNGGHFTGILSVLLDECNPYALLALRGGNVASEMSEAILLHSLWMLRNGLQKPSLFMRGRTTIS